MQDSTAKTVLELIQNEQDFEWYPTTDVMISVVRKRIPEDAASIMDIGAGDGRVLKELEKKCTKARFYGIELSQILIQKQPEYVIPVGTDIFEQNLSCLKVDYIFSNPPYSQFEEWVCKVISEGYCKKAFMVIPQRWKESELIKSSLKMRGATIRVIHTDDFHNAERQARAVIDIVEITFPKDTYEREVKDPFDIWFDQNIDTFEKEKEFEEDEVGKELAKRFANSSIDEMVEAYQAESKLLADNYRSIFRLDYSILKELGVNKENVREGLKKKMAGLKVKYWKVLFNRLDAITSRLSTRSKGQLLEKLTNNTSVEFTTSNAYSVVIWAIKNANHYFDKQLIDLFLDLSTFENVLNYKSNVKTWVKDGWRYSGNRDKEHTHYKLDYRIVVVKSLAIFRAGNYEWQHPGNLYKDCHELIADTVAVMSNLGFFTNSAASHDRDWVSGQWEDFYRNNGEILFQVKAHKNGNLHFRFTPEAIMVLNINAGRLLKWVRAEEDVVTEMGYTPEQVKQYFHHNAHILPSNIKLLASSSS